MIARPYPLVAGNWKMNGLRADGVALATALAARVRAGAPACDIALCPPATLLSEVARALGRGGRSIALGGQDCATEEKGAYTGEVSAVMLADLGCEYVIVGHSERRAGHGETSALVRAKAVAAMGADLTPIICVGETAAERQAGRAATVVRAQIGRSLPPAAATHDFVLAYEPVWAIGSGRTPTVAEIADMHHRIRRQLERRYGARAGAIRLLYGGSVKAANARAIMAIDNVDGGLIGGASLHTGEFWSICEACANAKQAARRARGGRGL